MSSSNVRVSSASGGQVIPKLQTIAIPSGAEGNSCRVAVTDGHYIYFIVSGKGIYKADINGEHANLLYKDYCDHLMIYSDGRLYYTQNGQDGASYSSSICTIKTDGSSFESLYTVSYPDNERIRHMQIVNDILYFSTDDEDLFSLDLSSKKTKEIPIQYIWDFQISGNKVYSFSHSERTFTISSCNLDGTGQYTIVNTKLTDLFCVSDGWIYYDDRKNDNVYRKKLANGSKAELIYKNCYPESIVNISAYDARLFIATDRHIIECSVNGSLPKAIYNINIDFGDFGVAYMNNCIYIPDSNYTIIKVNTNLQEGEMIHIE